MSSNYEQKLNKGLELFAQGNILEAKEIFTGLVNAETNSPEPYYCLAIIKYKYDKDYQTAIYYLKKALKIVPFFDAYKALAENYLLLADLKNALYYLKQALIFDSNSQDCLFYLKRYFPKEINFVNNTPIKIKGVIQDTKSVKEIIYKKIYDAGIVKRDLPKYVEELLSNNQKKVLLNSIENLKSMEYKEGFVIKVPNGKVYLKQSEQTQIITEENWVLADTFNHPQQPISECVNSINVAENLLVLSTCYSANFYHWLTWTIPKLYMIEKAGYSLNNFDKIAINYLGYSFQNQILSYLNIPINKIIGTIPKGVLLNAKNVIASSTPNSKITPPIVVESLRSKFLNSKVYDINFPQKIYLSRKKSSSRYILNEECVENFLQKEGFVSVCAEDYTFLEQVKLFANAKFVISQHGAGLVNLAFCSPNTRVIEIHDEAELWKQKKLPDGTYTKNQISDNAFMRISADNNLKYHIMYGDVENINLNVDIKKLKATYELANG